MLFETTKKNVTNLFPKNTKELLVRTLRNG